MADGVSNAKIYEAIMGLKEDMGSVKQGVKNNQEFTTAVSKKADGIRADLDNHKADQGAHGADGERRVKGTAIALAALIVGVAEFLAHWAAAVLSSPRAH